VSVATGVAPRPRVWQRRRFVLGAGLGAVVIAAGAVLAATRPFGGTAANPGAGDNGATTGLATVSQRTLTSQTSVAGTLRYGGSTSVVAASGAAQQAITQAQQGVATAQAALAADRTAAADSAAASDLSISQAQAAVTAAQTALSSDQSTQATACAQPSSQACAQSQQTVAADQAKVTQTQNALASAQTQAQQSRHQSSAHIAADQTAMQNAESALATAQSNAVNPGTTYTALPSAGQTVSRGQPLYALSGVAVPLFYGTVTPWRDLAAGISDGPDVGELTANLIALGFGDGLTQSDHFSAATQAAVQRWQASLGAAQTGAVRLGDVVFEPGAVIVTSVTPTTGAPVQPGAAIMQVTSTTRQVVVNLDAAQQSQVKVGDAVTITLPNNHTTSGTVSTVGTVATAPSNSGNNSNTSPTIEVDITLTDPSATGTLDQAPVQVSITTASVDNALVVPVTALVALSGGGYAVEVVDARGAHRLAAVTPGLFDDADGLVQVSGDGVAAGDRVVVPST